MTTPRVPSSRVGSGPVSSSLGRAATMPTAPATVQNLPVGPTTPGVSASGGLSNGLTRFFETLGIADDPVWKPAHPDEVPPF